MTVDVQWWCSARGEPWTWRWRAYPGVWLSVGALALWLRVWNRREGVTHGERAFAVAAILLLWVSLDWPVGPLGAGYLASVHTLQFVSLAMVAPALVLASIRRGVRSTQASRGGRSPLAEMLTQPLAVAAAFSIVLGVTHAPVVVDGLMRWQLGAFALDAAWFGIGVLFWWPVIIRWPHRPWFNPLVQMLYLYFGTKAHLGIAIWLLMAQFPVYATYELTPRVTRLSAIDDQQLAGTIMGTLVEPLVLAAITIVFFRWYRRVESELGPSPPSRAREQIDLSI